VLQENPTQSSVADDTSQTDRRTSKMQVQMSQFPN